jgi:hypothetical protein
VTEEADENNQETNSKYAGQGIFNNSLLPCRGRYPATWTVRLKDTIRPQGDTGARQLQMSEGTVRAKGEVKECETRQLADYGVSEKV